MRILVFSLDGVFDTGIAVVLDALRMANSLSAAAHPGEPPPFEVERWFNTDDPPTLVRLRGKVVVLHAFQMLCPGCVAHALPQAKRLHEIAQRLDDRVVLGLHSVFEHHAAMTPVALEAFLHENVSPSRSRSTGLRRMVRFRTSIRWFALGRL